jgi:hypothetical protein
MRLIVSFLWLALAAADWSGPSLSFNRSGTNGLPEILVDREPSGPPLWLTLHLFYSDLAIFEEQVSRAFDAGFRVVCICLTSDAGNGGGEAWLNSTVHLDNRSKAMMDHVVALHPSALFMIRFYAQQYEPTFEDMVLLNLTDGDPQNLENASYFTTNSLSLEWEKSAAMRMTTMLEYLDRLYPRRIAGVFPCFLHTSEWFLPGPNDIGFGGKSHISDYSNTTERRFCSETAPGNGSCRLPLPSQRNHPVLGTAFADVASTKLNLWLSDTVVHAIETLAETAKRLSGGKLAVVVFYGYLLALADTRLTGSGHLALHRLLRSPHVDGVASPYLYSPLVRNSSLGPLVVHGPWDSPALHDKIWVVEDDSRTSLALGTQPLKFAVNPRQSKELMRRNVLQTLMRGNAAYFYDLVSSQLRVEHLTQIRAITDCCLTRLTLSALGS